MLEATDHNSPDFFCSLQSRSFDESPVGSAPSADVWFMLEYNGRWGSKALKESNITDNVKIYLNSQMDAIEKSRLLLIKQKRDREEGITFFAAITNTSSPKFYRFELNDYKELLTIDLKELVRADGQFDEYLISDPLFFVCTNGVRDKCCARNGVPTFEALSKEFGASVWQSSHHGGHRFSANMLVMPYGLSYGRMELGASSDTVQAFLNNEMPLKNLRGRTNYSKLDQAAEAFLRGEMGETHPLALELKSSNKLDDEEWEVIFKHRESKRIHAVRIHRHESDTMAYVSCIGDKQAPIVKYALLDHKIN